MSTAATTAPVSPSAGRGDGLLIAFFAWLLYLAVAQSTLYADTGVVLLGLLQDSSGYFAVDHHPLWTPCLRWTQELFGNLGLNLHRSGTLLSATCTAVGLGMAHTSFGLLGLDRRQRNLATALLALCPTLFFFATVMAPQGLSFLLATGVFLATASAIQRPALPRVLLLGACTAIGGSVDAGGALFMPLFVLLFGIAILGRLPLGRTALLLSATVVADLATAWITGLLTGSPDLAWALLDRLSIPEQVEPGLLTVLGKGWLRSFLPLSVLALFGLARRETRPLSVGILLLLPLFVLRASSLAESWPPGDGAAFVPLALPAAWITARLLSPRWAVAMLLLGAILSIARIGAHDRSDEARAYARGLESIQADGPPIAVLLGEPEELDALFVHMHDLDGLMLIWLPGLGTGGGIPPMQEFGNWITSGKRALLTQDGEDRLRYRHIQRRYPMARELLRAFERDFDLRQLEAAGFRAKELRLK